MSENAARHRFFVESVEAESVELSAAEAHHALDVLRLESGAAVELFDGAGAVAVGALRRAGRKGARVEITQRRPARRAGPVVRLAFAVAKVAR